MRYILNLFHGYMAYNNHSLFGVLLSMQHNNLLYSLSHSFGCFNSIICTCQYDNKDGSVQTTVSLLLSHQRYCDHVRNHRYVMLWEMLHPIAVYATVFWAARLDIVEMCLSI